MEHHTDSAVGGDRTPAGLSNLSEDPVHLRAATTWRSAATCRTYSTSTQFGITVSDMPLFLKTSYTDHTPYLGGDAIKDLPQPGGAASWRSRSSITRCATSPRSRCATTTAGAATIARTPPIRR